MTRTVTLFHIFVFVVLPTKAEVLIFYESSWYIRERPLQLIEGGIDINNEDESWQTLILVFTKDRNPEQLESLIDAGANVNVKDHKEDTPLFRITEQGEMDKVKFMLSKGAKVNAQNDFMLPITCVQILSKTYIVVWATVMQNLKDCNSVGMFPESLTLYKYY